MADTISSISLVEAINAGLKHKVLL